MERRTTKSDDDLNNINILFMVKLLLLNISYLTIDSFFLIQIKFHVKGWNWIITYAGRETFTQFSFTTIMMIMITPLIAHTLPSLKVHDGLMSPF